MAKKTFNMKDLSLAVAERFHLPVSASGDLTAFIFNKVKAEVLAGKQVRLHRFSTLEARQRPASTARNPQTGDRLQVPAHGVLKVTVAASFRDDLACLSPDKLEQPDS